ncbi:hypothetical protein U9M48_036731 [Paspalum notatum var. saurae]|uniref:Uncharacterized protein n=1 Tax=Paspalum notatum var. saurae TaxID=547442 RepID=A0AAQ3UFR1_PASNO
MEALCRRASCAGLYTGLFLGALSKAAYQFSYFIYNSDLPQFFCVSKDQGKTFAPVSDHLDSRVGVGGGSQGHPPQREAASAVCSFSIAPVPLRARFRHQAQFITFLSPETIVCGLKIVIKIRNYTHTLVRGIWRCQRCHFATDAQVPKDGGPASCVACACVHIDRALEVQKAKSERRASPASVPPPAPMHFPLPLTINLNTGVNASTDDVLDMLDEMGISHKGISAYGGSEFSHRLT